jgi:DNA-binding response OmpR family regulator
MERVLPLRSGRAGADTAPPVNGLRPFLVVLPSKGRALELQVALQEVGVPSLLALDEQMVEYWRRTENPRVIATETQPPWAKSMAAKLIRQGRSVVALSDEEEERIRSVALGFEDAFPLTAQPRETAAKLRMRYLDQDSLPTDVLLTDGPLRMDGALRRVWWRDVELTLSAMQFDLLAYLAARPGKLVSIETLRREVWREAWGDSNKVTKMIGRIRRAVGPEAQAYIASSRGYYTYKPR